ncbi:nitrogen regulation protein NtrB [Luminiphilus syltensis NOR5-1B]|uniref:Sensory histidine kinase/phosphatase NtrB n=1 Tax=Luminiphilus syltensis NOR5-1B TaxID=565045 RepID=B8KUP3_9GAMM|nr:nitrogen regulation protein NR(II) [Luminiphilus syltensis]EED34921.1 nitrogen regulation protein NtrB [Luminiphilus syltensis NOR5-1B]
MSDSSLKVVAADSITFGAGWGGVSVDLLATAVVLVDGDWRVVDINQAAETLLEISASRALNARLDEVLERDAGWEDPLMQARNDIVPVVRRGIEFRLRGGKAHTVDLTISPIERGVEISLILEFTPVDRMHRINEGAGLWEAQMSLREVVRGLAHEVKNPLGGIRGAAQLLSRELPDPALLEYTTVIMSEVDRLKALVDRLLGPREQLTPAPMNIHEILERVRRLITAEAGGRIRLVRDYDPSLPEFEADQGQLTQAVLNIAKNAVEAMPDGGILTFRTRAQRQYTMGGKRHKLVCMVEVQDSGTGIEPDMLNRLFLPMVTGRADGSGIGLAIAQTIANRHGGLVQCESQPGDTRFTLLLPMEV